MNKTLHRLLLAISAATFCLLTSCTTSNQAAITKGILVQPRNWKVEAKSDASGDARIRAALEKELLHRGLQGGKANGRVEFEDTWRWDIVMYLQSLHLRFYDGEDKLLGTGCYRQTGFHGYPSQESAVSKAFAGLEADGAFAK